VSPEITIRRYGQGDHEQVMSFLQSVLTEMGYEFLPDGKDSDIRDINDSYLNNCGAFYVADVDGEIHGCCGIQRSA